MTDIKIIQAENIIHSYEYEGSKDHSLDGIDFSVREGEYVVLLGRNGCGKSTLVKHLNALLEVQSGELAVADLNVRDEENIWKLRRKVGMVFQNPDNQFVSSIVEEDIAFGLENYETPWEEISEKITIALQLVGMDGFRKKFTHRLSGGQKQRIALAGVLAMNPDILVFDEATAMLDPEGKEEVLSTIRRLHEEEHKTIILISHYIEEAIFADRVCLMKDGRILASGTPREIITNPDLLAEAGLTPPVAVRLYYDLRSAGIDLAYCPLSNEELVEELCRLK